MTWDPDCLERSPALAPLRVSGAFLKACKDWPSRVDVARVLTECDVRNAAGLPLGLAESRGGTSQYEQTIHDRGEMQYREREWHDLFNALAWLAYPRVKRTLNAAHCRAVHAGTPEAGVSQRGRARDALTLFDENGAVVVCSDPDLLADLKAFRWKRVFWTRREHTRAVMRVFVVGHGLMEKALNPYIGMTAHAMLLHVRKDVISAAMSPQLSTVDERAAAAVEQLGAPDALSPLPVLGIPGWWRANEQAEFYDNERYFRPSRSV